MATHPPAQEIGDFRLERLIGRGGMALVYEACQLSVERRVALKLIAPGAAADPEYRRRFTREARATMELEHPHVVPVYGVGDAGEEAFIAMRLIEGEDLQEIVDGEAPLPAARVTEIVRQVASGLDAAHASGLVHRDVKPRNVMIERLADGREHCYLVDFGLATAADASSVTGTGAWAGTPAYVSPEQLRNEAVDARTDVYALGVLAFHAFAGRAPYAREHDSGTLLAHLHAAPPSLTELRPELPGAVDEVIRRALAKAPQDRYGSAGELADELARAVAAEAPPRELPGPAVSGRSRPRPGNLPARRASFVGRRADLQSAGRALAGARLLSIVGPGGVGKTTLALRLAAETLSDPGGAWVVELEDVEDAPALDLALARALGLRIASPASLRAEVVEFVEARPLLLVLDNCEHLLADAGALAAELLAACPLLKIVATSREPLSIEGERVHALGPLDTPGEDDEPPDILGRDAARLLLERAGEQGVRVALDGAAAESIARICIRLEGIPLAIELAAARLRTLPVGELERRLRDDLGVLAPAGTGGPERQRTLDGLIAWSWRLLDPGERAVLARLAVFPGSFTLDAAEAVATPGGEPAGAGAIVLRLADKSLLQVDADRARARFRMLQPVREFCLPHLLSAAEHDGVRAAHRAYYLAVAQRAGTAAASGEDAAWPELDEDQPNLRAAIESGGRDGDRECALRTALALRRFWARRGLAGVGVELLTATLEARGEELDPSLLGKSHGALARLATGLLGDARLAEPHALEALRLARSAGDVDTAAEALMCLSWSESFAGRAAEGLALAREALAGAESISDPTLHGDLLDAEGLALEQLGDVEGARNAYEHARDVFEQAAHGVGIAVVEDHLGNLALGGGDLKGAASHFTRALLTGEDACDGAAVAMATLNLALIDFLEGRIESARERFVDSLLTSQASGDRANIAFAIFGLALLEPEEERAAELHGSAAARLGRLDMLLSTREERLRTEALERLAAALGPDPLAHALERGSELRVQEIVVRATEAETGASERS